MIIDQDDVDDCLEKQEEIRLQQKSVKTDIRVTMFELQLLKFREWLALKLMRLACWVAEDPGEGISF